MSSPIACAEDLTTGHRQLHNVSMPSGKDLQQKIDALRDKIRHHEHRYYVLDDPEITDAEFDA